MLSLRFSDRSARWLAPALAAGLWAVAAGSLVLWYLHLPAAAQMTTSVARLGNATGSEQASGTVERALGHAPATRSAPDVQKRFALLGVIAADSGQGSVLIAVDGQPPRAFVQGQQVVDGWRLDSVSREGGRLASEQGGVMLELPLLNINRR